MSTTEGQDPMAASAEAPAPSIEQIERQLRRERSLLVTALMLALALLLLMRVGTRVWAVAIYDPAERTFVEHVYVPQQAQAKEALNLVRRRAQALHTYYATAEGTALFGRSNPSFEQRVRIAPARRMVELPAGASAQTLVVSAADALGQALRPVVDAWAIHDLGAKKPIAALPTREMAEQALRERLAAVSARVRAELSGNGVLVSEGFLQKVEVRPVRGWPVAKVLTVPQAVAYLSGAGAEGATHSVVEGESAKGIAAKYNARLEDLVSWNADLDLTRLRAGDKLLVRRPEAPLTVLTVERRTYRQDGQMVTMEVRRHDGVETNRLPAEPPATP